MNFLLSDMITCMSVYGARERLPVSTCLSSLVPSRASMGYSSSSINPFTPQRANIFNVTQWHSGAALFSTGLCSFLMTGRSWESFSRPSTTGICWLPDLFGPSDQTLQDQTFLQTTHCLLRSGFNSAMQLSHNSVCACLSMQRFNARRFFLLEHRLFKTK